MMAHIPGKQKITQRSALTLGFLFITLSVVIAYINPATDYELSIYESTPRMFFVCIVAALTISVLITVTSRSDNTQKVAVFLFILAFTVLMSIPLLRGYHFIGPIDSLTHLGWTKDMISGRLDPFMLRYPGLHLLALISTAISSAPLAQIFLILLPVFSIIYMISIMSIFKILFTRKAAYVCGFLMGVLFLPINHVQVHYFPHPTTQTILYTTFLFYLFVGHKKLDFKALSILIWVVFVAIIFFHPQQALNILLALAFFTVISILLSLRSESKLDYFKWVTIYHTFVFGLIFTLRVLPLAVFQRNLVGLARRLTSTSRVATEVLSRSTGLSAVGSSYIELFFKIFFVGFIFCIIASIVMLVTTHIMLINKNTLKDYLGATDWQIEMSHFFTISMIPTIGMFFVYIINDISAQYFRHLGLIMVIVSILAGFGLIFIYRIIQINTNNNIILYASIFIVILLVISSAVVIYPSPYIFRGSGQITEAQMVGYESVISQGSDTIEYNYIRNDNSRMKHAVFGTESNIGFESSNIPDHFNNQSIGGGNADTMYLIITKADLQRETEMYNGFRFSESDFDYLDKSENISKAYNNGGLWMYST